jgi:FtsH-binding integral membrane protein
MCLTTVVCSTIMFDTRVAEVLFAHPAIQILSLICPLVLLIPLYIYRHSHPLNLALLGIWTASLSVGVGIMCAMFPSVVVLQALILTAAITIGLTAYTFYAVANGKDFDFMGPWLFSMLFGLIAFSLLALFIPIGNVGQLVLAGIGAAIFCAYLVYDTSLLIKRYSVDDYVWASVGLYLDILNIFLRLLEIFGLARAMD